MKKHFILLSLLLFLAFITTACGGAGGSSGACDFYGYISQLTLSKYAFTIYKGSTDNVIAYVDGVDKTNEVTFTLVSQKSTKKETITTVDKGLINALAVGTSIYNVHADQTQSDKTFTVTVIDPLLPTLEAFPNEFELLLGHYANNEKVKITLNGQDVTDKVNFTSTNDNIAFIDENGIIHIVEEGEVNVIVHLDGANDTIVHIKVNKIDDTPYNPDIEYQYSNIYETEDGILIYKGETGDLDVIIDGLDKTNSIIYTSANETIATVNSEKGHGKIHGLEVGKTVISIKYENTSKNTDSILTKIHVTVLPKPELEKDLFSMLVGTTDQIRVNLHTANITNDCEYTTNNNKIAKVDETGIITSVGCKVIGAVTGNTNLQAQYTDPKTGRVFNLPITVNTYKNIIPGEGGNATTLTDEEKERLKEILLDTGMISNENDIDEIIVIDENGDVQIVIHTGEEEGKKIAVISEDGTTIKYISTEEVDENGDITVNPGNSDNEIGTINEDGTITTIITPGFYDANNRLIASWQDVTGDKIVNGALVFDENGNKVTVEESERSEEYQGKLRWYYEQHSNINGTSNPDDYRNHTQHFTQILKQHHELGDTATKLVMPDGVRVMGHYAFVSCNMILETIVFPNTYDGVTLNADGEIESIEVIGGTMSLVGSSYPKRTLMNYIIRTENPHFDSVDGVIYNEDHTILVACPMNKQKIKVLDGCEIFEECAFDGNSAIKSVGPIGSGADVEVPSSVTTLYCRTFRITTLEWIEFWDGLTCFGYPDIEQTPDGTGEHAKDITSDVNANGSQIFKDCKKLKFVYIPASVTKMGYTYNAQNKKFESFAQGADAKTQLYCEIEEPENGLYPDGWNKFWNSRGGGDTKSLVNPITPTWNVSREWFRANCEN